jgi:hypothetical protein
MGSFSPGEYRSPAGAPDQALEAGIPLISSCSFPSTVRHLGFAARTMTVFITKSV